MFDVPGGLSDLIWLKLLVMAVIILYMNRRILRGSVGNLTDSFDNPDKS